MKLIVLILMLFFGSNTSMANYEMCFTGSINTKGHKKVFNYHFMWIGEQLDKKNPALYKNVENFCSATFSNVDFSNANRYLYLWYNNDNSGKEDSIPGNTDNIKKIMDTCAKNNITVKRMHIDNDLIQYVSQFFYDSDLHKEIENNSKIVFEEKFPDSSILKVFEEIKSNPKRIFSQKFLGSLDFNLFEEVKNNPKGVLRKALEVFKKNKLFSASSDLLRPLIVGKYGGCYFDIGSNFKEKINYRPLYGSIPPFKFSIFKNRVSFKNLKLVDDNMRTQYERFFDMGSKFHSKDFTQLYGAEALPVGFLAEQLLTTDYSSGREKFFNNHFMSSEIDSYFSKRLFIFLLNNTYRLINNPILQLFFTEYHGSDDINNYLFFLKTKPKNNDDYTKDRIFDISEPYFSMVSPFAFSDAVYKNPKNMAFLMGDGVSLVGTRSWYSVSLWDRAEENIKRVGTATVTNAPLKTILAAWVVSKLPNSNEQGGIRLRKEVAKKFNDCYEHPRNKENRLDWADGCWYHELDDIISDNKLTNQDVALINSIDVENFLSKAVTLMRYKCGDNSISFNKKSWVQVAESGKVSAYIGCSSDPLTDEINYLSK